MAKCSLLCSIESAEFRRGLFKRGAYRGGVYTWWNERKKKKGEKKTVWSWVGRNVCVVSLGLALPGASQIRPSLSFSRSLEWPLEQDKKTRNWQLHRRNETVGFFSIYLSLPSICRPATILPIFSFLHIFTYHNLISLFWIWSTYLLLYQWLLPPFSLFFSRAYQVGGKPIHRRRWYWNCKYFSSPLVIATVSVVYSIGTFSRVSSIYRVGKLVRS